MQKCGEKVYTNQASKANRPRRNNKRLSITDPCARMKPLLLSGTGVDDEGGPRKRGDVRLHTTACLKNGWASNHEMLLYISKR